MTVHSGPAARPPAVAGTFYPAAPARLAATVDALLSAAGPAPAAPTVDSMTGADPAVAPRSTTSPRVVEPRGPSTRRAPPVGVRGPGSRLPALVVPHAGYRYSGPVAAAAYALVRGHSPARVVLVGPAHFVPLTGSAVPQAAAWSTPLGRVPVDPAARDLALAVPGVHAADEPHAGEHALEVQLPFLQRAVGPEPPILPVATAAPPEDVADLLDAVAADPRTLVVVSTDLSHHLADPAARDRDGRTIEAVLALRADLVGPGAACGGHALRGLLVWARRTGRTPALLAYRTSADATGDPHRVVGYAALALC